MDDLHGKNLMLMGGTNLTLEAIERAQRMGVLVNVVDYNKGTMAKRVGDYAFDVSTTDIDGLREICEKQHIDGIFTNWIDSVIPHAYAACKALGYPFHFTEEQIDRWIDKKHFKVLCKQYGVPVPEEYPVPQTAEERERIPYPVIVKPVDSSGSRGISICFSADQLESAIERARKMSRTSQLLIEQYVNQDEITVNYVIQDGEPVMTCIHDRYFNIEQEGVMKVPDIYIYPSRYTEMYMREVDPLVKNMLIQEGIKNVAIFLQACVKDGKVYFYESGMRLNGCKIYQIVDAEYGYNSLDRMIRFALTGNMGRPHVKELVRDKLRHWYATMSILCNPGRIARIIGLEEVRALPENIGASPWYFEGDTLPPEVRGTLPQTVLRVSLRADTKEHLLETMAKVYDTYHVLDAEGNNMLLTPHDLQDIARHLDYEL